SVGGRQERREPLGIDRSDLERDREARSRVVDHLALLRPGPVEPRVVARDHHRTLDPLETLDGGSEPVGHAAGGPHEERLGRLGFGRGGRGWFRCRAGVGQVRPPLDREGERGAEGEAHRDTRRDPGGPAAAHPSAHPFVLSPPIEVAIARSSSSASPGASSDRYRPPSIHSSCERSGVNRPGTTPTSTADWWADVAGGSSVTDSRCSRIVPMPASASSSLRYSVTPAPYPASTSSTLASPNPAGSSLGSSIGNGTEARAVSSETRSAVAAPTLRCVHVAGIGRPWTGRAAAAASSCERGRLDSRYRSVPAAWIAMRRPWSRDAGS